MAKIIILTKLIHRHDDEKVNESERVEFDVPPAEDCVRMSVDVKPLGDGASPYLAVAFACFEISDAGLKGPFPGGGLQWCCQSCGGWSHDTMLRCLHCEQPRAAGCQTNAF